MKIYAYVTREACRVTDAAKPGSWIGRDEIPVSKHGDYDRWCYGKRETLAIANDWLYRPYYRAAASAVAKLMGWV